MKKLIPLLIIFMLGSGTSISTAQTSLFVGLNAGGSYQIGGERYISTASYYGGELIDYRFEETDFSGFGIFIKNSVEFNRSVSLNLTVYRYSFLGEYISFGPSFKIR